MRTIKVKINNDILTFNQETDGWFIAKGYSIDPNKRYCQTYPWYADYICAPPEHAFEVLDEIEG